MEDDASRPESEIGPEKSESDLKGRLEELEREAKRLREQLSSSPASDEASAPPQELPVEPDVETKPVDLGPPTREQLEKAERLIQFARLAKTRGQSGQANNYLHQAEEAAPNSPIVLEFVGDLFLEQKRFKDARAVYKRAFDLDPKNIGLERKWAMSIAATAPTGDPMMLAEYETMASGKIAAVLSAIIPGLGQIVLGEFSKGIMIFVAWAGMILWLYLIPSGLKGIVAIFSQKASQQEPFHPVVLVPIFIMFVIWISAMFDAKMTMGSGRKPIDRPIPLDDRPFE